MNHPLIENPMLYFQALEDTQTVPTSPVALTRDNFPAAFAAMDSAAAGFWAYPGADWQDQFLRDHPDTAPHFADGQTATIAARSKL